MFRSRFNVYFQWGILSQRPGCMSSRLPSILSFGYYTEYLIIGFPIAASAFLFIIEKTSITSVRPFFVSIAADTFNFTYMNNPLNGLSEISIKYEPKVQPINRPKI